MNSDRNIAVIGCGYWGKNLVRNFAALERLACVCEIDPDIRESIEETYPRIDTTASLEKVLARDDVEAVVIATPAETHSDLAMRCLEADRDVFVEKPLALSVSEGEDLVEEADRRGRTLMVGHLLWYHPAVLKLKSMVDEGTLGRIQYIYSNRLNLGRIRRNENALWSFAPHDISVILGLLGEMPDRVAAEGANYLNASIADVSLSFLTFPSGVKAHVFVSWLHPFKEQKLVVVGDQRMAVFNDTAPEDKLLLYPHSIEWKYRVPVAEKSVAEPVPYEMAEPLKLECEHFLDCIDTRESPRTDGMEGLRVLAVLDACQKELENRVREVPGLQFEGMRRPVIR